MKSAYSWKVVGVILLVGLVLFTASCSSSGQGTATPAASGGDEKESAGGGDVARPSNPGGPGEAVNLKGDANAGKEIFATNCATCHGDQGKGGVANENSKDETVPALNPIDPTIKSSDYKTFATNIDLFVEHGSSPEPKTEGTDPSKKMLPFGDQKILTPQQIADVIAYIISLNK